MRVFGIDLLNCLYLVLFGLIEICFVPIRKPRIVAKRIIATYFLKAPQSTRPLYKSVHLFLAF
jgi:hypothetical protein